MVIRHLGLLLTIGLGSAMLGSTVHAATTLDIVKNNTSWQHAGLIADTGETHIVYGALGAATDVRYFRLPVNTAVSVDAEIDTPMRQSGFQPNLMLYQPNATTIGPLVNVPQPPQTLGLIYGTDHPVRMAEVETQTAFDQRLHVPLQLTTPGTYYLAVYNTSAVAGRFRLVLSPGASPLNPSFWSYPRWWWYAHAWAGWSWRSLVLPGGLLLIIYLFYRWGMRRPAFPVRSSHHQHQRHGRKS